MQRALLMSVLFLSVIVPTILSKDTKPQRGMKRTIITMVVFIVIWGYCCRTFYYRLGDE
jgi:hypothetical protein